MKRYKHRYVFYYYPYWDAVEQRQLPGAFTFFGRVKDGKAWVKENFPGRQFDYKKLF